MEGTSIEVPDEVETQLDNDVEKNDDENYEEPSGIVNFHPRCNIGWLRNDWAHTSTSRPLGAYVDETHEKQAFTQSNFQRVTEMETQTSEDTSSREEEEKAYKSQRYKSSYTSQELTAKSKGTITSQS